MKISARFNLKPLAVAALLVSGLACAQTMIKLPDTGNDANAKATVYVNGSDIKRNGQTEPLLFGYSLGFGDVGDVHYEPGKYSKLPEVYPLANPETGVYSSKVLRFLDQPGMVFRLNMDPALDWTRTVGPRNARKALIDFGAPDDVTAMVPTKWIGFDEYLRFVEKVKGVPLIVLSIGAVYDAAGAPMLREISHADGTWNQMILNATSMLEYLNAPPGEDWNGDQIFQGQMRKDNGHEAPYNVWRFEVGNEPNNYSLSRGLNKQAVINSLHPEELADRAQAVIAAMRASVANTGPQGNPVDLRGKLKFTTPTHSLAAVNECHVNNPIVDADTSLGRNNLPIAEPIWVTKPNDSVLNYWTRAVLNGTAGLTQNWSQVGSQVGDDLCNTEGMSELAKGYIQYQKDVEHLGANYYSVSPNVPTVAGVGMYSGIAMHFYNDEYSISQPGSGEFGFLEFAGIPAHAIIPIEVTEKVIERWKTVNGITLVSPKISVTEYGRSCGIGDTTHEFFPACSGIYTAVGNSDFLIAAAQRKVVDLALHHGMSALPGTWSVFNKTWTAPDNQDTGEFATMPLTTFLTGDGTYAFEIKADGHATQLLARTLSHAHILGTTVEATNRTEAGAMRYGASTLVVGNYGNNQPYMQVNDAIQLTNEPPNPDGSRNLVAPDQDPKGVGYSVRATGFKYPGSGLSGMVAINRASINYPLRLSLPATSAGQDWVVRVAGVGGKNSDVDTAKELWTHYVSAKLVDAPVKVNETTTENHAVANLVLPGHAVMAGTALGLNRVAEGDFATTTKWSASSGCTLSTVDVAAAAEPIMSAGKLGVVSRTSGSSCTLSQTLVTTGMNLNDTYVLRAQVRRQDPQQPAIGASDVSVSAKLNGGVATAISGSAERAASPDKDVQTWVGVKSEFVPAHTLGYASLSSAQVNLSTAVAATEINGVTLLSRPNLALEPAMIVAGSAGRLASTKWVKNGATSTATVTFNKAVTSPTFDPAFFSLNNTVSKAGAVQLVQKGTPALAAGGALDAGRFEKWRLKARVRYKGTSSQGLTAPGAALKVEFLQSDNTTVYAGSPLGGNLLTANGDCSGTGLIKGTQTAWTDICLDFRPADTLGDDGVMGSARILLQLDTLGIGRLDVSFMTLERLADQ